jgi:hypothetical protein
MLARNSETLMNKLIVSSAIVLASCFLLAAPASARECEGVTMPNSSRVDGERLTLNGMGIREATVFNVNVYIAGLYVEGERSRNANDLLDTAKRKRLVLHFVRDVDGSDITEAFTEGFRSSAGSNLSSMQGNIRRLNGWMTDMEEGDVMQFTYIPGTGLRVDVKGRNKGTIEGDDFARAFFGIWLGSSPPNSGLKRGLLGGSCG